MSFIKFLISEANASTSKDRNYYSEEEKFNKLLPSLKSVGKTNGYIIYQHREDEDVWFFLAKDEKYSGYVVMDGEYIFQTHSNITGGFYKMMFEFILTNYKDRIYSDTNLSPDAIKAYEKLNQDNNFDVGVLEGNNIVDFSVDKLLENSKNVVSIGLRRS